MSDASARERRAAERKRRRDRREPTDEGSTHLQDALRSAASAAAVGAAVGAAKAMSTRRREDHDAPDTADEAREAPGHEESPEAAEPQEREPQGQEQEPDPEPEPVDSGALREIVARARGLLRELHGSDAESVSSVSRSSAGWNVALEVVELRRIPDSTDVLASYQVELDDDGRLIRYERVRRYNRSQASAGGRDA